MFPSVTYVFSFVGYCLMNLLLCFLWCLWNWSYGCATALIMEEEEEEEEEDEEEEEEEETTQH
jgi:hypothetical protein